MTRIDTLKAIMVKCDRIIALGAKRTQGEWHASAGSHRLESSSGLIAVMYGPEGSAFDHDDTRNRNAAYIAACAGRAEAAARSTKLAIQWLLDDHDSLTWEEHTDAVRVLERRMDDLIAKWEGVLK